MHTQPKDSAVCLSILIQQLVQDTQSGGYKRFDLQSMLLRKFRRWKTLVGVEPLNRNAADNKIFPAG